MATKEKKPKPQVVKTLWLGEVLLQLWNDGSVTWVANDGTTQPVSLRPFGDAVPSGVS